MKEGESGIENSSLFYYWCDSTIFSCPIATKNVDSLSLTPSAFPLSVVRIFEIEIPSIGMPSETGDVTDADGRPYGDMTGPISEEF